MDGNTGMIIAAAGGLLIISGSMYMMFRTSSGGTSTSSTLAPTVATLAPPLPTTTDPPYCPENYAPVVDRWGKIYKNACYAEQLGAQFAPTPFTAEPSVAIVDPLIKALLAGKPSAANSKSNLGSSATIDQGGQRISGANISQGVRGRSLRQRGGEVKGTRRK